MTRQVEYERVKKFVEPFGKLTETLAQTSAEHLTGES